MRKINLILGFVIIISVATVVVAAGVILNAARKLRLVVLRCMFIAAFKIIRIADKLTFGRIKAIHALYWPTMWLSHYLNGSGKTLVVPTEVMEQAAPLFTNRYGYLIDSHNGINVVGLHHSTLYEGSGFHGRPSLFYLVGGFTYRVEAVTHGIRVYGEDVYDWHPAEYGKYFTSPIGTNKIICALAQVILGSYFSSENSVTGEKGISNRLWEDFLEVGASDFLSVFDHEYALGEDTYVILTHKYNALFWEGNQWRQVSKQIGYYDVVDLYDGHYDNDYLHYSQDKALEAQRLDERYWDYDGPAYFYEKFREMGDEFYLPKNYLWKIFFMQMHKEIQNSYYWNFELWLKERWPHYEAYMFS